MIEGLQRTLALFVALTAVCSGQDGAGIALGITDSSGGLNKLADIGGRIVERLANSGRFPIPDANLKGLEISKIRITKLSVDRSVLTTSSSGITPDVEVSAALVFDWRYCIRIIGCHGDSGTLNARIALRTTLQLEVTDGKYRVKVEECTPSISKFDINLGSEFVSQIVSTLTETFFKDTIEQRIAEQLCRPLVKLLENEGSDALNGFEKFQCIDEFSCIDYSLVGSLVTTDNFVEARARGMFYSRNNTKPYPFLPGNLTVGPSLYTNCAFYVHVSEYVANTALSVYYRAGQLKYTACLPFQFDLTLRILMSVNPFCTRRAQFAFKDRSSPDQICTGQFFIKAARRPFIEISNNSESIIINLSAHAELVMAGCSICSMPLDAVAALVVNVTMENSTDSDNNVTEVVKLSGRALSFDIKLNSKLCPVIIFGVSALFPKLLDRMVEHLANSLVLPELNSKLGEGFTLPDLPDEIHLVQHSLHLNNGYITACFDLDYFDTSQT